MESAFPGQVETADRVVERDAIALGPADVVPGGESTEGQIQEIGPVLESSVKLADYKLTVHLGSSAFVKDKRGNFFCVVSLDATFLLGRGILSYAKLPFRVQLQGEELELVQISFWFPEVQYVLMGTTHQQTRMTTGVQATAAHVGSLGFAVEHQKGGATAQLIKLVAHPEGNHGVEWQLTNASATKALDKAKLLLAVKCSKTDQDGFFPLGIALSHELEIDIRKGPVKDITKKFFGRKPQPGGWTWWIRGNYNPSIAKDDYQEARRLAKRQQTGKFGVYHTQQIISHESPTEITEIPRSRRRMGEGEE